MNTPRPLGRPLCGALLLTAAPLAVPAAAQCPQPQEVLVHTVCVPEDCGSPSYTPLQNELLSVPKFDPSFGTLERVELDLAGTFATELCFINLSDVCCLYQYTLGTAFVVEEDPANAPPLGLAPLELLNQISGTTDVAASDGDASPDDCAGLPGCAGSDGFGISIHDTQTSRTVVVEDATALSPWVLGTGTDEVQFLANMFSNVGTWPSCLAYTETVYVGGAISLEVRYVYCPASPGDPYCFGDGGGAACPCANAGAAGAGCANSAGAGATLGAAGSASASADDLELSVAGLVAGQPALLAVGDAQNSGGAGEPFGDGLRCVAGQVVRLAAAVPDAAGACGFGPDLGALGAWGPGDTRHFQVRYRDPAGPCATGFNLSNGLSVQFAP